MIKKLIKMLSHRRIQGAIVIGIIWLLQQLNVIVDEASIAKSVLIVIQALGALWGVWGIVDADPKEPA